MPEFKPGQTIRCTIERVPASKRGKDTILRLMRQDDGVRAGLRKGQKERARATRVYIRGGRNWFVRPRAGKGARVGKGESWTMDYTPLLGGDLRSVENYLSVETV